HRAIATRAIAGAMTTTHPIPRQKQKKRECQYVVLRIISTLCPYFTPITILNPADTIGNPGLFGVSAKKIRRLKAAVLDNE
ncbi:MAG TPA: hypothetical protein DEQ77_03335, partial [Candidatus Omnitrophica bacterium]|nr:hypothetical protein [Candidatus Omnitrophota bacterium]